MSAVWNWMRRHTALQYFAHDPLPVQVLAVVIEIAAGVIPIASCVAIIWMLVA